MESADIKTLSEKNFSLDDIEEIKKSYDISFGSYENFELKKCIDGKKPFYIKNYFIIGHEGDNFISDKEEKVPVERMVKAVIIEDIKDEPEEIDNTGDFFAIINRNDWEDSISEFRDIISPLKVGEVYLPPHSAVFNFVKPTKKQIDEKIVSMLEGININVYSRDNYFDNILHEIGHLFFRTCLNHDEKKSFKKLFEYLKPSAIYEYQWERTDEEEVFCTIYKFFMKSLLLNRSFYNILAYEEPEGLKLLEKVFERKAKDKMIDDVWSLEKENVFKFINPKGRVVVKTGTFDSIKDVELPDNLLNDVDSFRDGITYINLNKAVVPVIDNRIDWEKVNG